MKCWTCGTSTTYATVACEVCAPLGTTFQEILANSENGLDEAGEHQISESHRRDNAVYDHLIGNQRSVMRETLEAYLFGWLCEIRQPRLRPSGIETDGIAGRAIPNDLENPEVFLHTWTAAGTSEPEEAVKSLAVRVLTGFGQQFGQLLLQRSLLWLARAYECDGQPLAALRVLLTGFSFMAPSDDANLVPRYYLARLIAEQRRADEEQFWALATQHWPSWGQMFRHGLAEHTLEMPFYSLLCVSFEAHPVLFSLAERDPSLNSDKSGQWAMEVALLRIRDKLKSQFTVTNWHLRDFEDMQAQTDARYQNSWLARLVDAKKIAFREPIAKDIKECNMIRQMEAIQESTDFRVLSAAVPYFARAHTWYREQIGQWRYAGRPSPSET